MGADRTLTTYEQVLLLGLHDEKGVDRTSTNTLDSGVAGAALIDLLEHDALAEDGDALVATGTAPDDPLLAAIHAEIAREERARKPKHWVDRLPGKLKPFRELAARRLVEEGVLGEEHRKVLGLFPSTRFPERDGAPEARLRSALHDVLVTGREPTPQEASLIAVLRALDVVGEAVEREHRKQAKKRAKEVAEAGVASEAVRKAVQDVHAAVMTAVIASTVVTTSS